MSRAVLADAFGLIGLVEITPAPDRAQLLADMTDCVEKRRLHFPREVADELAVLARETPLAGWGAGLGSALSDYRADIVYNRQLMAMVASLGFPEGFSGLDNKDPSLLSIARLACQYRETNVDFMMLTTDLGEGPLRPSMGQLCTEADWIVVDPFAAKVLLGL
jgi:hypothetical protein